MLHAITQILSVATNFYNILQYFACNIFIYGILYEKNRRFSHVKFHAFCTTYPAGLAFPKLLYFIYFTSLREKQCIFLKYPTIPYFYRYMDNFRTSYISIFFTVYAYSNIRKSLLISAFNNIYGFSFVLLASCFVRKGNSKYYNSSKKI
jgi:hypothetical protein